MGKDKRPDRVRVGLTIHIHFHVYVAGTQPTPNPGSPTGHAHWGVGAEGNRDETTRMRAARPWAR